LRRSQRHAAIKVSLYQLHDEEEVHSTSYRASPEKPDDAILREEVCTLVQECVGELSPKYAEVLRLSDFEGKTPKQIASEMAISVPAVKSRLHRARMELKERMSPYYEYDHIA
jgi:RNA polymerase sigma-70 factor, ECF subfamily